MTLEAGKGLKLGVGLPQAGPDASPENVARVAEEAERMGYDSVWVFERLLRPIRSFPMGPGGEFVRLPELFANVYDPLETLAYVAAKTERIKLGTSIMNALFHALGVPLDDQLRFMERLRAVTA